MIIFDQLRVSDDGSKLYINVHVNQASYFDSIYLDTITIMTADKVLETTYCTPTNDFIYKQTLSGNEKELHLVLDEAAITAAYNNYDPEAEQGEEVINSSKPYGIANFKHHDFSKDLFFVYVTCKNVGTPNACFEELSCRAQELTTIGVTFDSKLLYQRVMNYTRELANNCEVPSQFIDFILNFNAFKASVETDHFCDAIRFYNQMFNMSSGNVTTTSKCGCHG